MSGELRQRFDVLVVGGGPAGMAAAACAAESGVRVGIVDDNASLGGQIWRGESQDHRTVNVTQTPAGGRTQDAARWIERLQTAGAAALCGVRIFDQPEPGALLAEGLDGLFELRYDNLVLATGARERFLPFPSWTLPNVMGAGGLQAMAKCGLPVRGKRVVVAGTGPLLLAVAAYLRKHGAEIPIICEQASWSKLAQFGIALLSNPEKIGQGLRLKRDLAGVPFAVNSWPVAAHGSNALEAVTVSCGGESKKIACDYLACGFHLVPNVELPLLLGCKLANGYVAVDDFQQTTEPNVFCAGEPTGIGGVESSLIEGEIAGLAAAGRGDDARALFGRRRPTRSFADRMDRAFRLRKELASLAAAETIVCRCEDV